MKNYPVREPLKNSGDYPKAIGEFLIMGFKNRTVSKKLFKKPF
jgi:hypothetical protein